MKNQEVIETSAITDKDIIARILQGEKNLYRLIISRYNQRLYRIGMSLINNDAEVEDAMQVCYIKAYENLGNFAFQSLFSTWLTRILINECLLRLKKRKPMTPINDGMLHNENDLQQLKDTQTPLKKMLNTELKNILEQAILQLPEKYRTVFIMREIENMNTAETQECLNLSEANVKVRLNRAKVFLQNSLRNYYKKDEVLHFHLSRCNLMAEHVMKQIELL